MTSQRCAAHHKLNCVECAHQRTRTIVVNVDPTALEGADVRGDPHASEPEVWDEIRDKLGFHVTNRADTLVALFYVVWTIEFVIALVWFISSLGGSK